MRWEGFPLGKTLHLQYPMEVNIVVHHHEIKYTMCCPQFEYWIMKILGGNENGNYSHAPYCPSLGKAAKVSPRKKSELRRGAQSASRGVFHEYLDGTVGYPRRNRAGKAISKPGIGRSYRDKYLDAIYDGPPTWRLDGKSRAEHIRSLHGRPERKRRTR